MKFATALLGGILLSLPTIGRTDNVQSVYNNMAHEMIECAAYFYVVSVAMHNSNDPKGERDYQAAAETAVERAGILSEAAGLLPETVAARIEISLQEMINKIGANTSNISILYVDYADLCLEVMKDMEARGQYWIEKQFKLGEDTERE